MERVVVTGIGAVTPFGFGIERLWESVLNGKNGITKIKDLKICGEIVGIAGCMPEFERSEKNANAFLQKYIPEDDCVAKFFMAVEEAIKMSGLNIDEIGPTGCIGSFIADRAMGPSAYLSEYIAILKDCGMGDNFNRRMFWDKLQKYPIAKATPFNDRDSINHFISRVYNITGPQLSIGTACASGTNAIGEALLKIRQGSIDCAIAGGAFNFELTGMIGFTRIGALTTNPDPETACCPFDRNRSGFVMGSGCGILILENLSYAKKRGANILCELKGYGSFSDAYRATDPDPDAKGAQRTIRACLDDAKILPEGISYVNAHGTSTKMNDYTETVALKRVLGDHAYKIPVSSTKSMIGHGIMAAGAIEACVSIKSILENVVHKTRNWHERDSELDLDYVPNEARRCKVDNVLSNSFGFGGQNASILFSRT